MEKAPEQLKNDIGFPPDVEVPEGLEIVFVSMDNPFMQEAFKHAQENPFEGMTITSSVLVVNGEVLSKGINGDGWHQEHGYCNRERLGLKSGEGYDKCEGCKHENHSERVAIRNAPEGFDADNAEIYMYGHWWSCEPCMQATADAGIKRMYVLEKSKPLFDRADKNQANNKKDFVEEWRKKLHIE